MFRRQSVPPGLIGGAPQTEKGDSASVEIVSEAGRFDFLKPGAKAWSTLEPARAGR